MKLLSEFIKQLEEIKEEHGDLQVVYSADDEGNRFGQVYFGPTAGFFSKEEHTFTSADEVAQEIEDGDMDEDTVINSICIN